MKNVQRSAHRWPPSKRCRTARRGYGAAIRQSTSAQTFLRAVIAQFNPTAPNCLIPDYALAHNLALTPSTRDHALRHRPFAICPFCHPGTPRFGRHPDCERRLSAVAAVHDASQLIIPIEKRARLINHQCRTVIFPYSGRKRLKGVCNLFLDSNLHNSMELCAVQDVGTLITWTRKSSGTSFVLIVVSY
jgi:hypothetical protein